MKIEIAKIKVAARIRKQAVKIEELAADIQENGLINPITVMPSSGAYQLLAGLRRLKAAQLLGWTEIDANCVDPQDAEAALHIEHSENEQREPFTFSEKMDYGRLIEEIESAKAKERKWAGQKIDDLGDPGPQGRARNIVGEKIGMSGRQYDRAKYLAEKAPQDVIDELDSGDRSIRTTYDEMRAAERPSENTTSSDSSTEPPSASGAHSPFPAPGSDLDRAINAEMELDAMKYRWHNEIYHRDGIIENLNMRIATLEKELAAANERIHELEAKCEAA